MNRYKWYNTTFPIDRFPIDTASEMVTKCVVQRGDYYLRFIESLKAGEEEDNKLILDFDAYTKAIEPREYLNVTDRLHDMITDEYKKCLKEPVYNYMRGN